MTFTKNSFPNPSHYIPNVFEMTNVKVMYNEQPINLVLCDTAGQGDYDRLRPLSYPGTDVFLICFDLRNPESLTNIESKWFIETQNYIPNTPIILVGCKNDTWLESERVITEEEGILIAQKINSYYIECSSYTQNNLKEVFNLAISIIIDSFNSFTPLKIIRNADSEF